MCKKLFLAEDCSKRIFLSEWLGKERSFDALKRAELRIGSDIYIIKIYAFDLRKQSFHSLARKLVFILHPLIDRSLHEGDFISH